MVGILTFHKAINYGAVLQAYALRSAVESFGYDCSVINYAGRKMLAESKAFYIPKNSAPKDKLVSIFRLPMRAKTVRKFNAFQSNYLNLSVGILTSVEQLQVLSKGFDKIITGSDQVFNYNGTGEDFNFYLEFEKDCNKKIAYAPSFGMVDIDENHRERVTACLKGINNLSVRESVGGDIVETLLGTRPKKVCDPTFLIKREQWISMCRPVKINKPYVLVYSFGSRHLECVAEKIADDIGGIVVNINRAIPSFNSKIKNAYAPSPNEFLWLIKNASVVVTNSFHGMALSVLLGKEFYGFKNSYANSKATNSRFEFFINELGLKDRIFNNIVEFERKSIDYTIIDKKIEALRQQGLEFLNNALKNN